MVLSVGMSNQQEKFLGLLDNVCPIVMLFIILKLALYNGRLSTSQIKALYSGKLVEEQLLAYWSFDNYTNPFANYVNGISLVSSSAWSGNVVVPSDAPLFSCVTSDIVVSTHIVVKNSPTTIPLLPCSLNASSITILTTDPGINITQLTQAGCVGEPIEASQLVSNANGQRLFYFYLHKV